MSLDPLIPDPPRPADEIPERTSPVGDPTGSAPPPVAGTQPLRRAGGVPASGAGTSRRTNALVVAMAVVAVLAGSALFASGWTLGRLSAETPGTPADEAARFQPFWDSYHAITERYAGGEVDRKSLVEGAIKGMISALGDPFSQYLSSEEFKTSLEDISNQYEGIGATIGTVDAKGANASCDKIGPDCRLAVVSTITGSPADRAGLRPGDVISRIDGSGLDGLAVNEASGRLRGPKDTTVRVAIVRDNGTPFEIAIVRAVIVAPDVESKVLAGGTVGYIRLSGFSDHGAVEFDAAVASQVAAGRHKLIVDLRGNPGGFVTAARDIVSQFLAKGTVFWEQDAQGVRTEVTVKPGGAATDPSIRLVLLVDGGSASASEIVAAALHDNGRATLIGSTTYGKGTVQQWTQLEGDYGGFRLTIARWLTPKGVSINGKGIEPDTVITAVPAKPGDDPVLAAALQELAAAPTGLVGRQAA